MSVLRAHSQIHLKYLGNMGVTATLRLSILRYGKQWGLIACHNMTPRLPSFSMRTVAEAFGQMFSLVLDRMLIAQNSWLQARGSELHNILMVKMADGMPLACDVSEIAAMLDALIAHDGLSLNLDGAYSVRGAAPTHSEYASISGDVAEARFTECFATSSLANAPPAAANFAERAAGALFIPISHEPSDCLILWRRPLKQSVVWAGNPDKAVSCACRRNRRANADTHTSNRNCWWLN